MQEETSLFDYYLVIRKRIKAVLAIVVLVTLSVAVYLLFAVKIYQANAVILPQGGGGQSGLPAWAMQLAGLGAPGSGGAGMSGGAGSKIPLLLTSYSFAERVAQQMELDKVFFKELWDENGKMWKVNDPKEIPTLEQTALTLMGIIKVEENESAGALNVVVEWHDPVFAAKLVNEILKQLQAYIHEGEFTEIKKKRIFVGNQLVTNKADLLLAGKELSMYYQKYGISSSQASVDVPVGLPNILERTTNASGKVAEISDAELQVKIDALQSKSEALGAVTIKKVPQQIYLEYLQQKKVMLTEMHHLLAQQYAMALMEEAREDLSFQIIDPARVPKNVYKPKKKLILQLTVVMSLMLGVIYAFIAEYFDNYRKFKNSKPS